jgi:uridine kinase
MLGDVLLITEKHKNAAEVIFKYIMARRTDKMIIAISGESGSGKSELTHTLAKRLRREDIFAKPLHTDNYYTSDPLVRKEWRVSQGIENVVGYSEYDWATIHKNIEDFKRGRKSEMPCVDLVTEQVDRLITDFSTVDMLIVDGLYAMKAESVDLKIFIELTYLQTKDKHTKDSRGKEMMDEARWAILHQEHNMVQALKPMADLLINLDYQVVEVQK